MPAFPPPAPPLAPPSQGNGDQIDFKALWLLIKTDPCAAYDELMPHWLEYSISGQAQKIQFRERQLWLYPANAKMFETLLTQLAASCPNATPMLTTPKRRAIAGGTYQ